MWYYNIIQIKFNARLEASLLILASPESIIKPTDRVTKWLITLAMNELNLWKRIWCVSLQGKAKQSKTLHWILLSEFEIFLNLYTMRKQKRSALSMIMKAIEKHSFYQNLSFYCFLLFLSYSFLKEKKTFIFYTLYLFKKIIYDNVCIP